MTLLNAVAAKPAKLPENRGVKAMQLVILFPLGAVLCAWAAAKAIQHKQGERGAGTVKLVILSLVLSAAIAVMGGVPFYLAETMGPSTPGDGASFVFLAWIVVGPFIAFMLIPLVYAGVTALNLAMPLRRWGFPAAMTLAGAVIVGADMMRLSYSVTGEDLAISLMIATAVFVTWLLYVTAMDRAGRP